jgi:hypothetical protein
VFATGVFAIGAFAIGPLAIGAPKGGVRLVGGCTTNGATDLAVVAAASLLGGAEMTRAFFTCSFRRTLLGPRRTVVVFSSGFVTTPYLIFPGSLFG